MDFLTDLFTNLAVRDSLLVLLFLFIAFLIGLIAGWLYWRRRLEDLRTELTGAQNTILQLRSELDEMRIKLSGTEDDLHKANMGQDDYRKRLRICEEEKGQLRADIYALTEAQENVASPEDAASARLALSGAMGNKISLANASDKDDLKRINGIGPALEKKLNELGIYTYEQVSQFDDDLVEKVNQAIEFFPGRIARDNWVGQALALYQLKQSDPDALVSDLIYPSDPNDLKIVEGIGPKIEQLLKDGGIHTWRELADAPLSRLQEILDAAGDNYRIHDPATWPKQAELAANGDWAAFKEYTDFLIAGRSPDEA